MSAELQHFNSLVDRFAVLQGWIDKAQELAPRYRPVVVERVVSGHTHSRDELAMEIVPLMAEIEGQLAQQQATIASAEASAATVQGAIEELNLRHLIGEMDDDGLAAARADFDAQIADASQVQAEATAHAGVLSEALERWATWGVAAGVLQ